MSFNRILVAIDGGEQSDWATDAAADLAARLGASLAFVHVIPVPVTYATEMGLVQVEKIEDLQNRGQAILRRSRDRVDHVPSDQILREGLAHEEIVAAAAEWKADLIIIGTHNRGRLARFFMGSTAESVLHHATCPVLVMNNPFARKGEERGAAAQLAAR